MAIHNRSSDINAMLRKYGVGTQFHRQIEAESEALFDYSHGAYARTRYSVRENKNRPVAAEATRRQE